MFLSTLAQCLNYCSAEQNSENEVYNYLDLLSNVELHNERKPI